jgi:uncharacterized membrane protein YccC
MTGAAPPASAPPRRSSEISDAARLTAALKAAGPPLLFGLRLWLSVCLALYIAFWLELDNAYWAGTSAAIMCQPHLGASLRKGWYRLIGTVIGAVAVVVLTACFPQDRAPFLVGLALWGAGCALVATLLKNFAAYSAALAGYTVAIIASDQLGATGGPNGQAFMLAVYRASEICIGIVSAGVVLAGTDFGQARRRLATLFAAISSEITRRYAGTLAVAGANFDDTQEVRREIVRRVIALDPVIDEAFGESSQLRYHSPVLQTAVKGLLAALASWRAVAVHLRSLTANRARQDADAVLEAIPEELRSAPDQGDPGTGSGAGLSRWIADPTGLRRICEAAVRRLISLPASVPSLRLLADQTAEVLAGISRALNGLALLIDDPARPVPWGSRVRLRVPDWLPSLVNAGRAFVVIGAAELFWIVTEWPNGAQAITFTAVGVILLAPRADQAYAAAKGFMVGTAFGVPAAAIIGFAVLPNFEGFAAFSLALALVLVPVGAGMAQPWQTVVFMAMAANFVPLLAPANQQTYNTQQFYNAALAIVGGLGAAAFSFRLIPPLSPAYRTRRLLMLTVRDLRRLAGNRIWRAPEAWEDHMYGRLLALPDEAQPLQRAQILAALSVATEIIQLRYITSRMDLGTELNAALEALGRGDVGLATACFGRLDDALSARPDTAALRARGSILAMTEVLTQHAAYFEAGEPA